MIGDVWQSFRRLPLWVQAWVALVLVPVNMVALAFLSQPGGGWVAVLAIGAMALNLPILLAERGLSKAMAWPHLAPWPPLLVLVGGLLSGEAALTAGFGRYLVVLFVVDAVSLAFDIPDAVKWLRGDRAIA